MNLPNEYYVKTVDVMQLFYLAMAKQGETPLSMYTRARRLLLDVVEHLDKTFYESDAVAPGPWKAYQESDS